MLSTIILDSYRQEQIKDIDKALGFICSESCWSAAGIYIFWNISTREILYIGLASDLRRRFQQHNGLVAAKATGCKYREIQKHFSGNEYLGYTIIVQSTLAEQFDKVQPSVEWPGTKKWIEKGEGQLIASFEKHFKRLPKWNKINGQLQKTFVREPEKFFKVVSNQVDSPVLARSTLREIATNPKFYLYENWLHGVRSMWLSLHESIQIPDRHSYDELFTLQGIYKRHHGLSTDEIRERIESKLHVVNYTYDVTRKSNETQFWELFRVMYKEMHPQELYPLLLEEKYYERCVLI